MALRRLALLPDNDRFLRRELARIQKELPRLLRGRVAQPIFIGRGSVRTSEPNLAAAIRRGIVLWASFRV